MNHTNDLQQRAQARAKAVLDGIARQLRVVALDIESGDPHARSREALAEQALLANSRVVGFVELGIFSHDAPELDDVTAAITDALQLARGL